MRTLSAKEWSNRYKPEGHALLHTVPYAITVQYERRGFFPFFEDQSVPEGIPPLTHEQHVALDGLHFTSEDRALDIDLLPGDFEFFSNLKIFHARTWSEDDATHTRHLLKLWLRNEKNALPHPEVLDKNWDNFKSTGEEVWPLEAWEKTPNSAGGY